MDALTSHGARDLRTRPHRDAQRARFLNDFFVRRRTLIEDASDLYTRPVHRQRGAVRAVITGRYHHVSACHHGPTEQKSARRTGQHDARPVVVGEHQGALDRTGGDHHVARPHLPQALTRQVWAGFREVIGHPLQQTNQIVGIPAERRGARQEGNAPFQASQRIRQPIGRRLALDDGVGLGQQGTARFGLFIAQHDPRAGAGGGHGGGDAGRAGADHQHVAMGVLVQVPVGIGLGWRAAQAGGGADRRFIDPLPERRRPEEGLVVKPSRQQRSGKPGRRAEVEAQRRKAVLAAGVQPVVQFHLRGAEIGRDPPAHAPAPAIDGDQGVRLLRPGRQNAARAMVFERAPEEVHAVRQQGRRQRVTFESRVVSAVETKADFVAPDDAAAGVQAIWLAHGLLVAAMRSVTVSRTALKNRPQPC